MSRKKQVLVVIFVVGYFLTLILGCILTARGNLDKADVIVMITIILVSSIASGVLGYFIRMEAEEEEGTL